MSAGSSADQVVDELLPDELDWTDLVRRYPKSALALAALGGFMLGRRRGPEIVEALSEFAANRVTEGVNQYLGQKVL